MATLNSMKALGAFSDSKSYKGALILFCIHNMSPQRPGGGGVDYYQISHVWPRF